MSYVRWSSIGSPHDYDSSVYIYDDVQGGITCCGCANVPTVQAMVEHVEWHIAMGHAVPDFVIPRLLAGQNFN